MAFFNQQTDDKGIWVTARGDHGAGVFAHLATESAEILTLYWQGLAEYAAYKELITQSFIGSSRGIYWTAPVFKPPTVVNALVFTDREKVQLKDLSAQDAITTFPPGAARFLRLEFFTDHPVPGADPALVIWGRIDLEPSGQPNARPKPIGILLHSEQLLLMQQPIIGFIQRTHAPDAKNDEISDCVQTLIDHLKPAPHPHYTSA